MKISVAIPNYNGASSLKTLIPQLLQEDLYKIFIIDDASTDDSLKVLSKFSNNPKVTVIKNKTNLGPTKTRNKILPFDYGDVVVFLDADTQLITKNISSKITALFKKYPNAGVFGGHVIDKKGKTIAFNFGYGVNPIHRLSIKKIFSLIRLFFKRKKPNKLCI